MEEITRDLLIGVIGSVIGAALVFLGSVGWRFSKKAKKQLEQEKLEEERLWLSSDFQAKQSITNQYLFEILKYLLLGNICLTLPALSWFVLEFALGAAMNFLSFGTSSAALVFYYVGVGRVLRYMKLQSLLVEQSSNNQVNQDASR
ncbi:MAG: hypothetical protein N0C86_14805 [Candidatus Thiodiazotropha taylori]|nr:hypothetical protein [Candidatus Thiodiazotropha taylori]MCW4327262.1 hypothetical protein [Candidatus Thiodiazotropha taylori]